MVTEARAETGGRSRIGTATGGSYSRSIGGGAMGERIYLACWWVTIVIGIVVINAIDVAGPRCVRDWVFGQTGAAWVQAIGSIGAIVGAFALVSVQAKRQQVDLAVSRFEAQRQTGQLITVLIAGASSNMGGLIV